MLDHVQLTRRYTGSSVLVATTGYLPSEIREILDKCDSSIPTIICPVSSAIYHAFFCSLTPQVQALQAEDAIMKQTKMKQEESFTALQMLPLETILWTPEQMSTASVSYQCLTLHSAASIHLYAFLR